MPTIEFNKYDFFELIGEDGMDDEELEKKLVEMGVELEDVEDDKVKVETTSDRVDLLSVEGIARNFKTYYGEKKGLKKYSLKDEGFELIDEGVEARKEVVAAAVKNVKLNTASLKSLIQLQEKLHETFGRGRRKVSIGIHDMDDVEFPLNYKAVSPEEISFEPLGMDEELNLKEILEKHDKGKKYGYIIESSEKWPIITDSNKNVLSFPPVINGTMTEVTESSKNLFIDITGTDKETISYTLNVIVTALAERGGEIHEVEITRPDGSREKYPDLSPKEIKLDPEFISETVGIDLDRDSLKRYLEKMGHEMRIENGTPVAVVPPYRSDMLHQVDVVEDVAMGYGYSNLEPEIPNISTVGEEDDLEKFNNLAREIMIGFGYQEIMNPTLRNREVLVEKMLREESSLVEIKNPVSNKYTCAKDLLVPQLIETLSENSHNKYPQKVFESGDTLIKNLDTPYKAVSKKKIACLNAGKDSSFSNIVSELKGFLRTLGADVKFEESDKPFLIPGRAGKIVSESGKEVGFVGELHPQVLENFELEVPVSGFEVDLTKLNYITE